MTAPDHVHATLDDPVVAALSESVGGPVGPRAAPSRWWTPVRALMVIAGVFFALGMVQKSGCYADGFLSSEVRYHQMCYSDLPYLYTGRGLSELAWPYDNPAAAEHYEDPAAPAPRFDVMEYPVGISYFAYGSAWVTHWASGSPDLTARKAQDPGALFGTPEGMKEVKTFYTVQVLAFAALTIVTTWLLAGVNRRRPWDAAAFAASPMLLLTAEINWDVLALVLVGGALWGWARDRPVLTGVMLGLGTATKLYPGFLLGGLLVICIKQRRWKDLALASVAAAVSWVLVNLPAYRSGSVEWKHFFTFNQDRGPDLGSFWIVLQQHSGKTIEFATVNHWSIGLFVVWCLGVAALGLLSPGTPRLAQLGFLVVTGFLLVNKVYSPQYVLWLLPLAVLARPRWRDQLIWQATELVYFASVWFYLDNALVPGSGDTNHELFYWAAIIVRMLGELYLCAVIVRDVLQPDHDVVERDPLPDAAVDGRGRADADPPAKVAVAAGT